MPPFTMLYVGAVEQQKGILDFLRIVESARFNLGSDIRAVVIGIGSLSDLVKDFSSRVPQLTFLGRVSEQDKIEAYNKSHVLISPSKFETFHLVSAEGQLCGLPVVSARLSGPSEIIEDNVTGNLVTDEINSYIRALVYYYRKWDDAKGGYRDMKLMISDRARHKDFCQDYVVSRMIELLSVVARQSSK